MDTALFVDKHYTMNPEFEDLLFDGTELREGMIVLLESSSMKESVGRADEPGGYALDRLREVNQWATVVRLRTRSRFEYDEYGNTVGQGSPLIEMMCEYADGTKRKRSYDSSYAWIVKKDSIPDE